ncbi:MAG TPA: hypothetical protein VG148_00840 [Pyrinomonadaceae bacterium]|nr:hypothetical protein [Pyrinomonadaceae bacterium]
MWKTCFLLLIMLVVAGAAPQRDETIVPLEGLDPVLLTRGEEAQGDEQLPVRRGRFRYLFARAETKAAFEKEPARYEIQLGGACARMGPTVQGNPDLYAVHAGRIYLFGSPACLTAFKARPERFLETEAAAAPASEEARARGRALLERAVEAAGGAARLDGLVSYQERATVGARTPQGTGEIKTALVVVYPDRVRQERTLPFGRIATVLTPGGGFFVLPRGVGEITDVQRAEYEKLFSLSPLAILRARRAAGFTAAAAGAGKAGEAAVELVDVAFGGVRARLGVDPATGRVLSLSYRGRGDQGAFGQIVRTYSDFRDAGGLTLPFKTAGTFDGEPDPAQSSTVESIVINGEVSPALFERPKPAAGQ